MRKKKNTTMFNPTYKEQKKILQEEVGTQNDDILIVHCNNQICTTYRHNQDHTIHDHYC